MKTYLFALILLLLSANCSRKNAFENFDYNELQELSASSLQQSKIENKNAGILGFSSVLYLNEIYKKRVFNEEHFYIYLYIKDENAKLSFTLNGVAAKKIELLKKVNKHAHLTKENTKWYSYYLVTFPTQKKVKLHFSIESDQYKSDALVFLKDQE